MSRYAVYQATCKCKVRNVPFPLFGLAYPPLRLSRSARCGVTRGFAQRAVSHPRLTLSCTRLGRGPPGSTMGEQLGGGHSSSTCLRVRGHSGVPRDGLGAQTAHQQVLCRHFPGQVLLQGPRGGLQGAKGSEVLTPACTSLPNPALLALHRSPWAERASPRRTCFGAGV